MLQAAAGRGLPEAKPPGRGAGDKSTIPRRATGSTPEHKAHYGLKYIAHKGMDKK